MRILRNTSGFTMMEMLLAVTLFTMVIAASFSVFSMGIQIWRRSEGRSKAEQKVLLSLYRMGKEIRNAIRTQETKAKGFGDNYRFAIPSVVSVDTGDGKTMSQYGRISYEWNPSTQELCRKIESATTIYQEKNSDCRSAAKDIQRVKFSYWTRTLSGKSFSWYDQWDTSDDLPQAIKVEVEMKPLFKGEKYPTRRQFSEIFLIPVATKGIEEKQHEI